ncbi:MAG TPA: ATP-binding protein [Gemmatimonadota bacterium]|nr:ATP-binding protein [Gemmatimonadota bacterium]
MMVDYQYLPRAASALIERALGVSGIVVLTGARQTGKSTLTRIEPFLADRPYFTLDDLESRDRAVRAPDEFVRSAPRMTIDEVQRAPDLILAIKQAVDEDRPRVPGRFVLTGSANLLLMQRVSETLAGRATYVSLWPLTRREKLGLGRTGIWTELIESSIRDWYDLVRGQDVPRGDWREDVTRSGYPEPLRLPSDEARALWFEGYVRTYLERDLQDLAAIANLLDFRRLMRAACLRLGNLVNQAELARDTQIPRVTVQRYLNLLETSYQLVRLEPYSVNRTKRLIKAAKLYWSDVGLGLHLAGGEPSGAHLENLVLGDLLAWRDIQIPRAEILYWRTATNQEVDLVIESRQGLVGIEVKATRRPGPRSAQHLQAFRDEYRDRFLGGLLLHGGEETFWISDGILAAPWWRIV